MLEFVITADGSKTIYNSAVGENYHSRHGALQESRHVFLNSGLKFFLHESSNHSLSEESSGPVGVSILEVGFGTGLNFLLSADYCTEQNINLDYTGIEAYPLSIDMLSQTGYETYLSSATWTNFLNLYPDALKNQVQINSCQLQIAHCQLMDFSKNEKYDVIYFDAF